MSNRKEFVVVDLNWFVGREFALTGVGNVSEGDANGIRFELNGVTYEAMEDPNDGYRSSLRDIMVVKEAPSNRFPPCVVRAETFIGEHGRVDDVVRFRDTTTGEVVLEVGTRDTDDYYPCYVGHFNPEGMAVNSGHSAPKLNKSEVTAQHPEWASW